MLSDPQNVTVDGSARSLPRVATPRESSSPRKIGQSDYRTSDGTYAVATRQFSYRDGSRRAEIILRKTIIDAESAVSMFQGVYTVGVGFIVETGPSGLGAAEIANIRTAVNAYCDSALLGRITNGEV